MLLLSGAPAHHRLHARHQSLHRCGVRRYRSIPGAFLGGLLLGVIEAMAQAYISTQLSNTILFAVLIVVLLVKPSGLLGKYVPEKV